MTLSQPRFYVYILCRPPHGKQVQGKPFYVGKGMGNRVYDHETEARSRCDCRKCRTIRKIWKSGGDVQRVILFTTDDEQEAFAYEIETIALYGRENLCNHTDGGEGTQNISPETRAKLRAAAKARYADPAERTKQSAARIAHLADPDVRAQRTAQMKARMADPDYRAKHRDRMADPVVCAKRNAALKAHWSDPEARARLRVAIKAAWARRKAKM